MLQSTHTDDASSSSRRGDQVDVYDAAGLATVPPLATTAPPNRASCAHRCATHLPLIMVAVCMLIAIAGNIQYEIRIVYNAAADTVQNLRGGTSTATDTASATTTATSVTVANSTTVASPSPTDTTTTTSTPTSTASPTDASTPSTTAAPPSLPASATTVGGR